MSDTKTELTALAALQQRLVGIRDWTGLAEIFDEIETCADALTPLIAQWETERNETHRFEASIFGLLHEALDYPDDKNAEDLARMMVAALAASEARIREQQWWQPIDTAPKDGAPVLLWWRGRVAYWACGRWVQYGDGSKGWLGESFHTEPKSWTRLVGEDPTHWMPIPHPPGAVPSGEASGQLPEAVCPHCQLPRVMPDVCTPEINAVIEQDLARLAAVRDAGYQIGKQSLEAALAASEARVQALKDERDREKERTNIVIAEFDAPWPHSHTVGNVIHNDLTWRIHQCREAFESRILASEAARQQMQQKVEELLTIKVVDYSDDIGERLTLVEQALTALVVAWDNSSDEQLEHALAFARSIIDRERGI